MTEFLSQNGTLLLMVAAVGAIFYFLMIRPAKKQQQKQQDLMNSLTPGARVMLTSGVFGTIRHLGDRQAIIEISPGVDLTVLRRAITKVATADEEEFEYADPAVEDEADATQADGSPVDIDAEIDSLLSDAADQPSQAAETEADALSQDAPSDQSGKADGDPDRADRPETKR
ncbi:MAG: preprotein translocase subunit YajC [Propionibacteriaceae bacterium]|jgi:preprotein translocase subunit YajC|nr:preprotein translocase subunit YajC [Propionibacteriaceae bacterium]